MDPSATLDDLACHYQRQVRYLSNAQEELAFAEEEATRALEAVRMKTSKLARAVENEQNGWRKLVGARAAANPEKVQPLETLLADSPEKV